MHDSSLEKTDNITSRAAFGLKKRLITKAYPRAQHPSEGTRKRSDVDIKPDFV